MRTSMGLHAAACFGPGCEIGKGAVGENELQFSMHGAFKLAYTDAMDKKLGSTIYVHGRAAVSSCFAEKQDEIVKHRLSNDCSDYLFAERSFDDTPAHLSFGMLSECIAPIAKYVVPAKYRDMVGKSFADYKHIMAFWASPPPSTGSSTSLLSGWSSSTGAALW